MLPQVSPVLLHPALRAKPSFQDRFYALSLICFLMALMDTVAESNLRSKEFIWLMCPDHSPSLGQVRAGAQAEAEPRILCVSSIHCFLKEATVI